MFLELNMSTQVHIFRIISFLLGSFNINIFYINLFDLNLILEFFFLLNLDLI